jgi:hypothetical protein
MHYFPNHVASFSIRSAAANSSWSSVLDRTSVVAEIDNSHIKLYY